MLVVLSIEYLEQVLKQSTVWDISLSIICGLALVYWLVTLCILFKPIKRDRYLVQNFVSSVLMFVMSAPFALTAIVWIIGIVFCKNPINSKELVWGGDLYEPSYDTVSIRKELIHNDVILFHIIKKQLEDSDVVIDTIYNKQTTSIGGTGILQDSTVYGKILTQEVVDCKKKDGYWEIILKKNDVPDFVEPENPSLFWTVLYHFVDPGNQHMAISPRARIISFTISAFGCIILTGLLITVLISMFDRRRERWIKGELRYPNTIKNHIVIIGGGEIVTNLVKQIFYYKKPPYVLIQTKRNVEQLRLELDSFLSKEYEEKIVIYRGDRTSKEDISDLHLEKASEVYILGESENGNTDEIYRDSLNMRCLNLIASHISMVALGKKIKCYVMFEHQSTYAMFKFSDVNQEIRNNIIFTPFNIYEMWAQKVLVKNESIEPTYNMSDPFQKDSFTDNMFEHIWGRFRRRKIRESQSLNLKNRKITYVPIDGSGICYNDNKRVHMIIVGMTPMGVAMALETAQIAHYPNFLRDSKWRTTITFIDAEAFKEMDFLKGRYPFLFELSRIRKMNMLEKSETQLYDLDNVGWIDCVKGNKNYSYLQKSFLDVQWEFIQGGIENSKVRAYLENAVSDDCAYTTVAICRQLPYQAIAAGIYLPPIVLERALQILIYQQKLPEIVYDLVGINSNGVVTEHNKFNKIRPFGMADLAYEEKLMDETAPKLVNAFYEDPEFRADYSETEDSWNNLSIDLKCSNIYFVNSIRTKLRSVGLKWDANTSVMIRRIHETENESHLSKVEHNRWNMEKLLLNYRALTVEEWKQFDVYREKIISGQQLTNEEIQSLKKLKNEYKQKEKMAHLDLCPYEELEHIDIASINYDTALVKAIPNIISKAEELDKMMDWMDCE